MRLVGLVLQDKWVPELSEFFAGFNRPGSLGVFPQLGGSRLCCLLQLADFPFVLRLGIAVALCTSAELLLIVTLICTIVGVMTFPFAFTHPGFLAHAAIACLALQSPLIGLLRLLILLMPFGIVSVVRPAG